MARVRSPLIENRSRVESSLDDPFDASQVSTDARVDETVWRKTPHESGCPSAADFKKDLRTGAQNPREIPDHRFVCGVGLPRRSKKSQAGFIFLHPRTELFIGLDIRRVTQQDVHRSRRAGTAPVPLREASPLRETEFPRVACGNLQRAKRAIDSQPGTLRAGMQNREQQRSRPCAEVQNLPRSILYLINRPLDQSFAIGARDEDSLIHCELKPPESALPFQIGHWFALDSAGEQSLKRVELFGSRKLITRDQSDSLASDDVCEQDFGFQTRLLTARCA